MQVKERQQPPLLLLRKLLPVLALALPPPRALRPLCC
jgi:hypothetical protein